MKNYEKINFQEVSYLKLHLSSQQCFQKFSHPKRKLDVSLCQYVMTTVVFHLKLTTNGYFLSLCHPDSKKKTFEETLFSLTKIYCNFIKMCIFIKSENVISEQFILCPVYQFLLFYIPPFCIAKQNYCSKCVLFR